MNPATRLFAKFKQLLDVTWGSIADGQYLLRDGDNIVGGTPGGSGDVTGPAGSAANAIPLLDATGKILSESALSYAANTLQSSDSSLSIYGNSGTGGHVYLSATQAFLYSPDNSNSIEVSDTHLCARTAGVARLTIDDTYFDVDSIGRFTESVFEIGDSSDPTQQLNFRAPATGDVDLNFLNDGFTLACIKWDFSSNEFNFSKGINVATGDIAVAGLVDGRDVAADGAKLDWLTVSQDVDLDQMEIDIAALANGMVYKDDWDASVGTFPGGGVAQIGWFYNVSVGGTVDGVVFNAGDSVIAKVDNASTATYAANWVKKDQTDAVQTVAGRTGSVVLTTADLADFDSEVSSNSAVAANTAKTTNANHTGDVTGSGALTIAVGAVTLAKIAPAALSGNDATMMTGTAGTSGNTPMFNADGDLVDSGKAAADIGAGGGGGGTDLEAENVSGATLTKGTPVYKVAYDATYSMNIATLDPTDPAKAKCVGFMKADLSNTSNSATAVQTVGIIDGLDTSMLADNDPVYWSGSAFQNYPGTYAERLGTCHRSHATLGEINIQLANDVFEGGTGQGSKHFLLGNSLAADDTEIVIDGLKFDYYESFEIEFSNLFPSANAEFRMEFSSGGAVVTGSFTNAVHYWHIVGGSTENRAAYTDTNFVNICNNVGELSTEGVEFLHLKLLPNYTGNAITSMTEQIKTNGSGDTYRETGAVRAPTSSDYDSLRFFFATGNIKAGTNWKVWGIKA